MMLNKRKSLQLLGSSLLLGISTDTLVRQEIFGLNFLVWTLLWTSILGVGLFKCKKLNIKTSLYVFFTVANAVMVYVRAEPIVRVWSVLSTLTFLGLLFAALYLNNFFELSLVRRFLEYISGCVVSFIQTLSALTRALRGKSTPLARKNVATLGVVVGALLVVVFAALFASSDQVFRQNFTWLGDLSDWLGNPKIGRFITTLLWTSVALIWLPMVISRHKVDDTSEVKLPKILSIKDTKIILGSVCFVFAVFVFVQLRYLFGGATLPSGITYADYARTGYGQLLLATALASGVVYVTKNATKASLAKQHNWLSVLLLVLNGLVVVSAWKRLSLYESAYGWTMTRFVARMGLVCIMAGVVYLLIWTFGKLSNKQAFALSWYTLAVVLLGSAILNPIGLITKRNIIDLPTRETALDVSYLSDLSEDSYGSICKYAPVLKEKHPDDYKRLVAHNQYFDKTKILDQQGVPVSEQSLFLNRGLSAHYTSSKSFADKYYDCLQK